MSYHVMMSEKDSLSCPRPSSASGDITGWLEMPQCLKPFTLFVAPDGLVQSSAFSP
jgi:hypothetical protein